MSLETEMLGFYGHPAPVVVACIFIAIVGTIIYCLAAERHFMPIVLFDIVMVAMIVLAIIAGNHEEIVTKESDPPERVTIHEIVSVSTSENVNGSGSICHYVIATDEVYRYYYKRNDGSYMQDKVTAKGTRIVPIDETETPKLVKVTEVEREKHFWWLFFGYTEQKTSSHYELLIPEGSVVFQFNLN